LTEVGSESSHSLAQRAKSALEIAKAKLVDGFNALDAQTVKANQHYFVGVLLNPFQTPLEKLGDLAAPKTIDLTPNWRRAKYKDLIREHVRKDWFELSSQQRLIYAEQILELDVAGRPRRKLAQIAPNLLDQMRAAAAVNNDAVLLGMFDEVVQRVGYVTEGVQDFEVTGAVFEKLIEPTLIQPTFVTHLPKELVPLAKLSPDDPTTVEVFECCINGQEISPGYTEQNDPIAQRTTLEHQAGGEQQKLDEDFLVALEHGMPPAGGIGIGIDRLCMMLLGQESIRDVILFPQLKPK
jgi:lysyl-tRNA synthetase class 2